MYSKHINLEKETIETTSTMEQYVLHMYVVPENIHTPSPSHICTQYCQHTGNNLVNIKKIRITEKTLSGTP